MTKSCWNWLKWKFVNFCLSTTSGRRHADRAWFCSESAGSDAEWKRKSSNWLLPGSYIPNQSVRLTSRSCCRSKTYSPSPVVVPVVTGRVERGIIKVGEEVEIVGIKETQKSPVLALKCSANCWTKAVPVRT
ncbi:elongation factor Tu [Salmonella enterica subsp. enterica]|uniref:Elongation factor Tu n=1 Tax=Salmonella enterica I TaxID=59201 RepID=A0A379X2Q2_SALET|nr:elongation factor Tu [Salmonella enterica subsp. enterica]